MADPKLLKILHKGFAAWNKWRRQNFLVTPNLSGASLSHANLIGANLSESPHPEYRGHRAQHISARGLT